MNKNSILEIRCDGDLLFSTTINQKPKNKGELIETLAQIFNGRNDQIVNVESVDLTRVLVLE